jgi:hypothetical protein
VLPTERRIAGNVTADGPLVGRVRELQELRDSLAEAARGAGGVHLVLGDPGVGKTRLAGALCDRAIAAGAAVIRTRGWGRAAPHYWPWIEIVRSLCHGVDGAVLRDELGPSADELLRLVPELAERLPDARRPAEPAAGDENSEIARFALFDALAALLRARSAERPVVVLIDDLQAVDEGSLLALDFVSRMLRDVAVLLVVTMHERTPPRTASAHEAIANIARAGRRLVLGGLTRDDVAELIEVTSGAAPAPRLVDTVHRVTEGNPFFTREILALLLAEGRIDDPPDELPLPDGVRELIRRRLEPLSDDARATLALAAVIGRTFGLPALEHASPPDRDSVGALDAAAELGLVEAVPGTIGQYRFAHGLIVETLVADMTATARMSAHRAVGEALEDVYRGALDAHLPELAHHFLSAAPRGDLAKAVDYAERAAERALDDLAYEQAADLFSRALAALEMLAADVPRRAALLLGLGSAQSRAGRQSARATFEAAVVAARSIGADDILARAALGAAPFALAPGFVDEAHVALLVEALECIGPDDSTLRVRLLGSLAIALYWSDSAPRRARLAREAIDMARRLGDDLTQAFALASAQLATFGPDTTRQSLEWLETLFALSQRAGESVMTLAARSRHIDVLLELDDLAAADIAIETLERLARDSRDHRAAAFVPLHRARRASLEGRFDEAHRLVAGVAATVDELSGASTIPITIASQRVVLSWLEHGVASIGEHVRAYADGVPTMPVWRAGLAASLAASGRAAEARQEYDRLAADGFAALPRDNLWLTAMVLLTETAAALELPAAAAAIYAELSPFAARNVVLPTAAFLGPVQLWLGVLARVEGRGPKALEHLAAARTSAKRNGARTSLDRIAQEEAHARRARPVAAPPAPAPALSRETANGAGAVTVMRRIGDVWLIDLPSGPLHISDGRGVRLLALLLTRPGQEIHSLELVAALDRSASPGTAPAGGGAGDAQTRRGPQGGTGPALDAAAKRAYRARIAALDETIADAEQRGDDARAKQARDERAAVAHELDRAVGIGGRDRETGSDAERARVNVTRAIRAAIRRVASYDPRLGAELGTAVRTGAYCVYDPDPRRPRRWRVEDGDAR